MRAFLFAIVLSILTACGGGGGGGGASPVSSGPLPPTSRPAHYGYYFGCMDYAGEQSNHADLWWSVGYCHTYTAWFLGQADELTAARAAGMKCVVLHLPDKLAYQPGGIEELRFQFGKLEATGTLAGWGCILLYPGDEPSALSDEVVSAGNASLRSLAAEFPDLRIAKIGVIYNCHAATPGFESFDIVGCDSYDDKCGVTSFYDAYQRRMAPTQLLWIVPGGYGAAKQDPACFKDYASRNPKVWAIIPFLWQRSPDGGAAGIREEPDLRPLYEAVGRWVLGLS